MTTDPLDDDAVTNPTDNRPFNEVLSARLSRRGVMAGGAATVATAMLGLPNAAGAAEVGADAGAQSSGGGGACRNDVDFKPVPKAIAVGPEVTISDDYEFQVVIPWGTPIHPDGPAFSWPQTSAADQEQQIGIGHDGMWFFAIDNERGVLCINHEFGRTSHVLGKDVPESLEDVRIMQAAHGISVVKLQNKRNGGWQVIGSRNNRRITVNTPVDVSGPAAGSPLLDNPAGNEVAGTLNNCANGYTPWGTYLTCEENFNGYFGTSGDWTPTPAQERYGFTETGFGYAWHEFDPRFDLSNPDYANEGNRFGWVVEIDPYAPGAKAIKRTALGRVKHEGAATVVGRDGRAVVYMGDDQRFDYIYKFVSSDAWHRMRARGQSPLDHGQLYVARFNADGTGDWLELTIDNPDIAAEMSSQAEVVTYARLAADIVGATPMDRPEWTTVAPCGTVYCTLTNNTRRTEPNPANPLAPNPWGSIISWKDSDDHVGTNFLWDIVEFAESTHLTNHGYGSPDGLWADPDGRLFIETDGEQPDEMNDQMLVSNGLVTRRLVSGVAACEVTGIAVTPDRRTMFINLQHPGNGDPTLTNFPAPTDGVTIPRDATLAIRRKDGGVVGS